MSNALTRLSLQKKVSMTLLAVMAVLIVLTSLILRSVVSPAFDQLELQDARRNLIRAERAIRSDLRNLDAIVLDWARWDDAYTYARGEYPDFVKSNLNRPTLTNLNLNLLVIYDATGAILWGELQKDNEDQDLAQLGVFDAADPRAARLIRHTRLDSRTLGLLRTRMGPMLISSRPILTSFDEGPIAGTLIMAQFLDEDRLTMLRRRTEVNMGWKLLEPGNDAGALYPVPLDDEAAGTVRHESTAASILSHGVLDDLYGEPLLRLEATTPRVASALGNQTLRGALLFLTLTGVVVAIVTWLLLRRIIVVPLAGLANHITQVRQSGDLSRRFGITRGDEIGSLANEFDKLTAEVHETRRMLLEQSFKAGKADTAAEVLHNIRNSMTPLINGLERLGRHLRFSKSLRVAQATAELRESSGPADRREKLLQYVESAFKNINATCCDAESELDVVSRQAYQVEAILKDQEQHAQVSPVIEDLELSELLGEAVLVVPKADPPDVEIELRNEVARFRVRGHRVGLLQVLGNLILNAYESIKRGTQGPGVIRLSAVAEEIEDQQMVRVTVADSGGGFDAQTGKKIFQRGYSSKEGHMSGLGLHWCANALAGMGGRILAESSGPGRGAAFHVLLPAAQGG